MVYSYIYSNLFCLFVIWNQYSFLCFVGCLSFFQCPFDCPFFFNSISTAWLNRQTIHSLSKRVFFWLHLHSNCCSLFTILEETVRLFYFFLFKRSDHFNRNSDLTAFWIAHTLTLLICFGSWLFARFMIDLCDFTHLLPNLTKASLDSTWFWFFSKI